MEVTGSDWTEAKAGIQTTEMVLFTHMLLLCSTNGPPYRVKSDCFGLNQFFLQPRHCFHHY